jgi:hypothetical protein
MCQSIMMARRFFAGSSINLMFASGSSSTRSRSAERARLDAPTLPGYGLRGPDRASNSALSAVAILSCDAPIQILSILLPPTRTSTEPKESRSAVKDADVVDERLRLIISVGRSLEKLRARRNRMRVCSQPKLHELCVFASPAISSARTVTGPL